MKADHYIDVDYYIDLEVHVADGETIVHCSNNPYVRDEREPATNDDSVAIDVLWSKLKLDDSGVLVCPDGYVGHMIDWFLNDDPRNVRAEAVRYVFNHIGFPPSGTEFATIGNGRILEYECNSPHDELRYHVRIDVNPATGDEEMILAIMQEHWKAVQG